MKKTLAQLIGRKHEQQVLEGVFRSKKAEFIAVYGRRRVGKTYLIKTVFQRLDCVFFHITGMKDATLNEQIEEFTRILESVFYNNSLTMQNPTSWRYAFELLTKTIQRETPNQKIVLFFDELPWLAGKRSRFIQALDYYWNRYWSDMPQIKLIVCGSAASWMLNNIISQKGGLHNRISGRIALTPFNLTETKEFLLNQKIHYQDNQILEIFMVTGGIPYYLQFLKPHLSVPQNIDQLCFQNQGVLTEEFNRLYQSLFQKPEIYEELIRIIATKHKGIERTEILKLAKFSSEGGRIKERLTALEQSGFIVSFQPYGYTKRKTFYRVIDEYSLFYLNWIEPALNNIRKLDQTKGFWLEECQSPKWRAWAGYAFEAVCYKHLMQIRKALDISAGAHIGSWQYFPKKGSPEQGAQIDLLFDRNDNLITICEIKFTKHAYQLNKEEAQLLMRKIAVFKTRTHTPKQVHLILITNLPIKQTMYSEEMIVHNVILEDLFY